MLYYLNSFYIYSFLGFLVEVFMKSFIFKGMNSGILYGPWLPVYGIGAVIVLLIEEYIFKKTKFPRFLKIILIFLIVSFLLSLIEYLGGILIENVFHIVFWDYSDMKFNISKYASLEMSFVWGLGSLFIIYILKPITDKFIKKIPKTVTFLVSLIFFMDVILTFLLH